MSQQQHAAPSTSFPPSMDSPTRFEPPDKVVGPAFSELLNRLHRVRTSGQPPSEQLINDERVLFNYGVAQRRRVLEHAVGLILGQYLVYRQGVVKFTKSRPIRIMYGISSFVITTMFLRSRASQVTKDLFAHIATQHTDSTLGNEARIILAELEGPNGPYFQSICEEKDFKLSSSSNPDFDSDQAGQTHPQLKLTPRLVTTETTKNQNNNSHPQTNRRNQNRTPNYPGGRKTSTDRQSENFGPNETDTSPRKPPTIRMRFPNANTDMDSGLDVGLADFPLSSDGDGFDDNSSKSSSWVSFSSSLKDRDGTDETNAEDVSWSKPFDFASSSVSSSADSDVDLSEQSTLSSGEGGQDFTPSQRRAAERRKKREVARAAKGSRRGNRNADLEN